MSIRHFAFVAAAVGAGLAARAQAPAPQPPAIPEYKVEVIVFAHTDFDRAEERIDRGVRSPAVTPDALERRAPPVFDDTTLESLESPPPPFPPSDALPDGAAQPQFRFRLLTPEELTLMRERAALERVAAYAPIAHGGWVQQGLPENETRPVDLSLLGARNPRGTIELYRSRYLHLKLDLTYLDETTASSVPAFGGPVLAELPLAPRYTLRTERQIPRSGQLHYFDHPAFGVLVLVSPVEATPVAAPQPAA